MSRCLRCKAGSEWIEGDPPKDNSALEAAERRIIALEAALQPFAHPDLCAALGGNVQGDESIIFGRGTATIKLGDCRKARALLHDKEKT